MARRIPGPGQKYKVTRTAGGMRQTFNVDRTGRRRAAGPATPVGNC